MADFVPLLGSGYAAPSQRSCARCGCRLRHGNHEAYCAPCQATLHPWHAPDPSRDAARRRAAEWEANKGNRCACGGYKTAGARSCVQCHLQRIGAHHPAWYGPTCECGGRKNPEARMCRQCRYPSLRAAG
jgi:hypothetical protein